MQKLYLDCDGVILDTVSKRIYEKLRELGITTDEATSMYFSKLDWDKYIDECGQIDNSIDKIKELCNYYDIEILTHINSDNEGVSKIKYFDKMLPGVKVNVVPKAIAKADFIDPKGIILVDDFIPNLDYWSHKGGISVKFSDSGKECDYVTITDLMDLTKVNFKMRYKVKE